MDSGQVSGQSILELVERKVGELARTLLASESYLNVFVFGSQATGRAVTRSDIDLGMVTRTELADVAVADAAFKLELNKVSEPVTGKLGTIVLLRVTEIDPGKTPTFDEAKADLEKKEAEIKAALAKANLSLPEKQDDASKGDEKKPQTKDQDPDSLRREAIRKLTDLTDKLQAEISALRKAVQAFPLIPVVKGLIAHYREDPTWADVRPPFTELPAEEIEKAVKTLADLHGFKLDFAEAA